MGRVEKNGDVLAFVVLGSTISAKIITEMRGAY